MCAVTLPSAYFASYCWRQPIRGQGWGPRANPRPAPDPRSQFCGPQCDSGVVSVQSVQYSASHRHHHPANKLRSALAGKRWQVCKNLPKVSKSVYGIDPLTAMIQRIEFLQKVQKDHVSCHLQCYDNIVFSCNEQLEQEKENLETLIKLLGE